MTVQPGIISGDHFRIRQLTQEEAVNNWYRIRPVIEIGWQFMKDIYTFDEIFHYVSKSMMSVVIAETQEKVIFLVMLCRVLQHKTGRRELLIDYISGTSFDCVEQYNFILENLASDLKCDYIVADVRVGFSRILKRHGYELKSIRMQKKVNGKVEKATTRLN